MREYGKNLPHLHPILLLSDSSLNFLCGQSVVAVSIYRTEFLIAATSWLTPEILQGCAQNDRNIVFGCDQTLVRVCRYDKQVSEAEFASIAERNSSLDHLEDREFRQLVRRSSLIKNPAINDHAIVRDKSLIEAFAQCRLKIVEINALQ